MTLPVAILAGLIVGGAVAAVSRRNLVHAALFLAIAFIGQAALYLQLGAEFAGFVQILVYVGAVSMVIVFAILLTRGLEPSAEPICRSPATGVAIAVAVFLTLAWTLTGSGSFAVGKRTIATAPVKAIGARLIGPDVVVLQAMGLLLTAAMIGAAVIAMRDAPASTTPVPSDPAEPTQGGGR